MDKNMPLEPKSRLFFLDVLKAICITIVVSYHSIFVPVSTYQSSFTAIDNLFSPFRFCVPVLLTISFFLSERSLSKQMPQEFLQKRCSRLLVPILFWFGIAGALKFLNHNSMIDVIIMMLKGEVFYGAYYLLVLLQLTILLTWLYPWLQNPKNLGMILLIQGLVLVFIDFMIHSDPSGPIVTFLRIAHRPLIIYWFGYIALGILLYRNFSRFIQYSRQLSPHWKVLAWLVVTTSIGLEYANLQNLTQSSVPPFEYALITSFLSVPTLCLGVVEINEEQVATPIKKIIQSLSHNSLGIFCINGILSQIFLALGSRWFVSATFSFVEILTIKLVGWLVLLLLSLGLSVLLSRLGLKSVVS